MLSCTSVVVGLVYIAISSYLSPEHRLQLQLGQYPLPWPLPAAQRLWRKLTARTRRLDDTRGALSGTDGLQERQQQSYGRGSESMDAARFSQIEMALWSEAIGEATLSLAHHAAVTEPEKPSNGLSNGLASSIRSTPALSPPLSAGPSAATPLPSDALQQREVNAQRGSQERVISSTAAEPSWGGGSLYDLELLAPLGRGSYGAVYAAVQKETGERFAVKIFHAHRSGRGSGELDDTARSFPQTPQEMKRIADAPLRAEWVNGRFLAAAAAVAVNRQFPRLPQLPPTPPLPQRVQPPHAQPPHAQPQHAQPQHAQPPEAKRRGALGVSMTQMLFYELELARGVRHKHICQTYGLAEVVVPAGGGESSAFRGQARAADGAAALEAGHAGEGGAPLHALQHAPHACRPELGLVMALAEGGSLEQFIHHGGQTSAPLALRARLAYELALAVGHLHSTGILHCDLKLSNVLLTDEAHPRVQLCDFGIATRLALEQNEQTFGVRGTPRYMAPEVVFRAYGFPADVYSYGVCLYELLHAKRFLAKRRGAREVLLAVLNGERPPTALPQDVLESLSPSDRRFADAASAVVAQCWAQDWAQRPAMAEVAMRVLLRRPNIGSDVDWEALREYTTTSCA